MNTKVNVVYEEFEGDADIPASEPKEFFRYLVQQQMDGVPLEHEGRPAKYIKWEFGKYPNNNVISWSEHEREILWISQYYNNEPDVKSFRWEK